MASTTVNQTTSESRSLLKDMLHELLEKSIDGEKERVNGWISQIEEYADDIIRRLTPKQVSRRNPEIIAAAALYDAFLEFESRTNVTVRLPQLQESLGLSACSINTAWKSLFDIRSVLRKDYLFTAYTNEDRATAKTIGEVIRNITRALVEATPEIQAWIDEIEIKANQILDEVNQDMAANYDHILLATTAVYAAIQKYHGKPKIQISQRDFAQLCDFSPAMVSKIWLDFFANED